MIHLLKMRRLKTPAAIALAFLLGLAVAGLPGALAQKAAPSPPIPASIPVTFNSHFIEGLHTRYDVSDPVKIFALVFSRLPAAVTVYPTENYLYFSFAANGRTIWGNLNFDVLTRDKGSIRIGWFEYDETGRHQDRAGKDRLLTAKDGVIVQRVSRFEYKIAFRGKTVLFKLNDIGLAPPKKAKLANDEVYVGPVFDESGIKFFLVFNKTKKFLFYVLNEDGFVAETFETIGTIAIGHRTGFAFYLDKAHDRKILIGVNTGNTIRNNYYDGPFDQLPDNYADKTRIKEYIEAARPAMRGVIDKYGIYKNNPGAREAIITYSAYYTPGDLAFVAECERKKEPAAQFYLCLTRAN